VIWSPGIDRERVERTERFFNGAAQEGNEAVEAERVGRPTGRATSNSAGRTPAEPDPDVEQEQAEGEEEKADEWRVHRRAGVEAVELAITALDSEAATVAVIDGKGCPVEVDDDEGQPLASAASGTVGDMGWDEGEPGQGLVSKRIVGAVGVTSNAQGTGTTVLTAHGTSDDGGQVRLGQIANDRATAKAFVQINHRRLEGQRLHSVSQSPHNRLGRVGG